MRASLFALTFLVVLFGATTLSACETCVLAGEVYHGSFARNFTRCYAECEGDSATCLPPQGGGTGNCELNDDFEQCPDCEEGGSGGAGNGGGGFNDDTCARNATGVCPAECSVCSF